MDLTRHDTSLKIHIPRQYIHTYSHTHKYTYLCTMCLYKQFSINATVVGVLGGPRWQTIRQVVWRQGRKVRRSWRTQMRHSPRAIIDKGFALMWANWGEYPPSSAVEKTVYRKFDQKNLKIRVIGVERKRKIHW
jgi:hypothetical protein